MEAAGGISGLPSRSLSEGIGDGVGDPWIWAEILRPGVRESERQAVSCEWGLSGPQALA